ncbi:hypothetical protein HWC14_gp04 [Serratia phage Parlo]|uniref:Uncharacterized protein n=1 Tax=Serratia phage Parlo TaxID=2557554 RepID=A0A482MG25_9CAUD|nr:hypothetical protein HWC14_gp04 [Serratia phage Parlo]QBQ72153.1 hypothetical protein CPT_Parlo_004 [Serratia phage Parlo]
MKDHEIRELVNTLTAIAVTYSGTQQLREHISKAVTAALKPRFTDGIDPDMSNAACLREINEELPGMAITMFSQVATAIHDLKDGYETAADDKRRLVRELDVLLNGDGAAKQASLCDLVAQVRREVVRFLPVAQHCHCCGTGEVSLERVCHNKSCEQHEKGVTIFQGNYVSPPVPKGEA